MSAEDPVSLPDAYVTCSIIGDDAASRGVECPVCLSVLDQPLMHTECGNMFCQRCVSACRDCPICRASLTGQSSLIRPPIAVLNQIADVKVRCDVCNKEMTHREFSLEHCLHCPFPCPVGCGANVTMKDLELHLRVSCRGKPLCCRASEPPLCCDWKGYGASEVAAHEAVCPLVKLIPFIDWFRTTFNNLTQREAQLQQRIRELQSCRPPQGDRINSSVSINVTGAKEPSMSDAGNINGHSKPFSPGGRGCPGMCCPKCGKMADKCRDGGRYKCCGLCKDCGHCTATLDPAAAVPSVSSSSSSLKAQPEAPADSAHHHHHHHHHDKQGAAEPAAEEGEQQQGKAGEKKRRSVLKLLRRQSSKSSSIDPATLASWAATHHGQFCIAGCGAPGDKCPKCKRRSKKCLDNGRYACCGLCKECGPCTQPTPPQPPSPSSSSSSSSSLSYDAHFYVM